MKADATGRPDDAIPADVLADMDHVTAALAAGRKPDPEVVRRIRERSDKSRGEIFRREGYLDIAVPAIRELRGPLDEEQERELTFTQRHHVKRGERRLTDPDTGIVYMLVPEAEYERLRGT